VSKPFKLQGHTLPGPNQRSALKNIEGRPDLAGTLFDPNRGRADVLGGAKAMLVGGQTSMEEPTQTSTTPPPIAQDTGISDAGGGDTAKKKVDVEVTVNGQQV